MIRQVRSYSFSNGTFKQRDIPFFKNNNQTEHEERRKSKWKELVDIKKTDLENNSEEDMRGQKLPFFPTQQSNDTTFPFLKKNNQTKAQSNGEEDRREGWWRRQG